MIDAPHNSVFNLVTTWANLPKWLPVAKSVRVPKGVQNEPAQLGDVLYEDVHSRGEKSKIYTVVVSLDTITGTSYYGNEF